MTGRPLKRGLPLRLGRLMVVPLLFSASILHEGASCSQPAQSTASQTPPATATFSPTLERAELVTDKAENGPGGNDWGGHQTRIMRSRSGVFTAYTVPDRGELARQWRLAGRTPNGWRIIGHGPSGREPVNLLADRAGNPVIIAWPEGLPKTWSFSKKRGTWQFQEADIPGDWLKTQWPYAAAATDAQGDVYILQSVGEKPGELRWASRSAKTGAWSFEKTGTDYRYCYAYLLPGKDGELSVTATRDVLWKDLGYQQPAGRFDYVFNAVGSWFSPNAAAIPLTAQTIREEAPDHSYPFVECSNAQGDSYLDTRGRLHVLYQIRGPSTKDYQRTRQAVLFQGKVLKDVQMPFDYGTYSRIIQDSRGQFYILTARAGGSVINVYPASSEDGTTLGAPIPLDLHGYDVTYFGFALAAPRSGTSLADSVDGVFPSGKGEKWVYFRIELRGAVVEKR